MKDHVQSRLEIHEGNPGKIRLYSILRASVLPSLRVFLILFYEEDYIELEFREIISPLNIKISGRESLKFCRK